MGYCVFEGYSKNNFYFFDRDKKDSILSVDVSDPNWIRSQYYGFKVENFEIEQFHKTGKKKHYFFLSAKCTKEAYGLNPGNRCYLYARIRFTKYFIKVKVIKVLDHSSYFSE